MQESTHTLVSSLYMAHAYDHVHRKCIQVQIDMCMNMHMLIYKCPSPYSYIVLTFAFPSKYDFVMMASCSLYEFNMCPIFSQECDIKCENYDVFTMWISHMIMLLQNSWGLSSQIRSCSSNCEQAVHSTLRQCFPQKGLSWDQTDPPGFLWECEPPPGFLWVHEPPPGLLWGWQHPPPASSPLCPVWVSLLLPAAGCWWKLQLLDRIFVALPLVEHSWL